MATGMLLFFVCIIYKALMDPLRIIYDHYKPGSPLAELLVCHSRQVRDKALSVAARVRVLQPNTDFIARAAMLHDIGILRTAAPSLHCHGSLPYVCHGIVGRQLLEPYGLDACGLVCERHIGVGISIADIRQQVLPLPMRDMQPISLEEQIICYADKFFSKSSGEQELPLQKILAELARFGEDKVKRFLTWHSMFSNSGLNPGYQTLKGRAGGGRPSINGAGSGNSAEWVPRPQTD